jgi:hypothetical protein
MPHDTETCIEELRQLVIAQRDRPRFKQLLVELNQVLNERASALRSAGH